MINSAFSLAFNGSALLSNQNEMIWNKPIFQVTTSTDGHGSITASPMSGFSGTQVTLSNTPNANYGFQGYSVTGATLTGNKFTLNNDATARATFSAQPTAYQGGYNLQTYYNPVPSNPGSTMDENMYYTTNFIIPVGNVGGSYTRRYHVAGLAKTQGYPIYTGNVNNCIVLGNNRRISGHITANIHYPSNQANLICVGIDPNYTTYSAGTYTKKIPSQWVSANIISTASCNTFGQGGYTNKNVTFNIDTSNIAGTLFLATSGDYVGSPKGVYVNSFTANLIEMAV